VIYKKIQELIRRIITYLSQEKRTFPITDHKKEDKTTVKGDYKETDIQTVTNVFSKRPS